MKIRLPLMLLGMCAAWLVGEEGAGRPVAAQQDAPRKLVITSLEEAADEADFQTQGEFVAPRKGVQVIALGNGEFRAVVYNGGLPGAGWDQSPPQQIEGDADEMADLTEAYEKVTRSSPTLGAKPPAGSVVLFDGTEETFRKHWKAGARIEEGAKSGAALLKEGANSVEKFQDYTLHLEFLLPFMPNSRGQGRANSGIYHQGRYETQILDSFGLAGKDNECGGLYQIKAPDVNMCFPPLSWQTYDVEITTARFNEQGEKIQNARITARLNGVLIHDNVELPRATAGNQVPESAEPGWIHLQNHGDPVRFRNIWVLPRDADKQGRRPHVPGFERFHARADQDQAAGGRLLLGELNCVSCHRPGNDWKQELVARPGPKLEGIGSRVNHQWLKQYVLDPHPHKAGTTMPQMLAGMSEQERLQTLEPIVHFLAATGNPGQSVIDRQAVRRGDNLFHSVGCTICHGPMQEQGNLSATSVPLGNLAAKYTVASLKDFLKNPHATRPAGRMPSLHLDDKETTDLANYLLRDSNPRISQPNVHFQAYHGSWQNLPDFTELEAVSAGQTTAFDLTVAGRKNQFGLVFSGWVTVLRDGNYQFFLGSDDGSRLLIDGQQILLNNGVHPHQVVNGSASLKAGVSAVRIEYFEQSGDKSLTAEIQGPGLPRQDLGSLLRLTEQETSSESSNEDESEFVLNRDLIEQGRQQFAAVGCAACHEMKENQQAISSTLKAPPLEKLQADRGCLAETVPANLPQYDLSPEQRTAIQLALQSPLLERTDAGAIAHVMTAFNCYACHERGSIGGAEFSRNELFKARIPEMGDEGRLPPTLNGVADKLQESWLKHVLRNGAQDRTYMQTRMPKFQHAAVDQLLDRFVRLDQQNGASVVELAEPVHRVKAIGQELVSGNALACIKCHTFASYPATGIQAISLTTMHKRLRADWFQRYLLEPQQYRPGTRMPNSFLNGVSAAKDILEGQPEAQIAAMWQYLQEGEKAGIPAGLLPDPIELVPDREPIVYRNFIEGVSPRGIAVGFPEQAHFTWDANEMCLSLIWHGAFIDAGRHWRGRGQGKQPPLGVHVLSVERSVPFVVENAAFAEWPAESAKERQFRFRGYQLDDQKRPVLMYEHPHVRFREQLIPQPQEKAEANFLRQIHVEPVDGRAGTITFLVARGQHLESLENQWLLVDHGLKIQVRLDGEDAKIRLLEQQGQKLAVLEIPADRPSLIEQVLSW